MIRYIGTIDIIIDKNNMTSTPVEFEFTLNNIVTRDEVKKLALMQLKLKYIIYGVAGLNYMYERVQEECQ